MLSDTLARNRCSATQSRALNRKARGTAVVPISLGRKVDESHAIVVSPEPEVYTILLPHNKSNSLLTMNIKKSNFFAHQNTASSCYQ